jgi:hypothetical protein
MSPTHPIIDLASSAIASTAKEKHRFAVGEFIARVLINSTNMIISLFGR